MPTDESNAKWPENWAKLQAKIAINCGLHDLDWVGLKYNNRLSQPSLDAKNLALKKVKENRAAMELYFSVNRPYDEILVGRRLYRQHVETEASLIESITFLGEVLQGNFTGA